MKIIIFGGKGFIGSRLARLLKINNKVYIFGNKNFSRKRINNIKYNRLNFVNIFNKIKPDVIFFMSGNSYPNNTNKDDLYDFKSTNLVIQELLSALKYVSYNKLFLYASSIAVYGSTKSKNAITENFDLNPESFYGNSKYIAEKQIKLFSKIAKFNSVILRISSVYGPELKRQIIYQIIKKTLHYKNYKLNGSILDSRQFLYIDDCVNILHKLIYKKHKKYEIYNIAGGEKIKINNITKYTQKYLNKKVNVKFLNILKSPSLPKLSNKKILKKVGKIKFTKFEWGLAETIKWIINKF